MALPNASSFTKSKWLAFFAELSAKLTHHNVLVSIEGCETLKRLLVSQVSIAAFLQQGDLLEALVDTFVGGIRSERLFSASAALDEELGMTQLRTISLCVDFMTALYADGDGYYCLLVLARAGVILQGLLEALQRGHPHLNGLVTHVLSTLLHLPIGRDPSPEVLTEMANASAAAMNPSSPSSSSAPSAALKRHVQELAEQVGSHGTLLQDAADTLTAIAATTTGAQRCAALRLLNLTYKRLRKLQLRRSRDRGDKDWHRPPAVHTRLADNNVTEFEEGDATLKADYNVTITDAPSATAPAKEPRESAGKGRVEASLLRGAVEESGKATAKEAAVGDEGDRGEAEDISDLVDREAAEVSYRVPTELIRGVLHAVGECTSHEDFFASMNDLWALTVADGDALLALFDAKAFEPFQRFLTVAPATRQDRLLLTELLLWLGHVMPSRAMLPATTDAVLDVVGSTLLPMLLADMEKEERTGHGTVVVAGDATAVGDDEGSGLAAATGARTSGLPRSLARNRQEERMLTEAPSIRLVLLSFLLGAERVCSVQHLVQWVQTGGLHAIVEHAILSVADVKSALIDTPTTADGSLSEEVYLASAMRMVRKDDVTFAVLGCKLLASLLTGHSSALVQQQQQLSHEVAALLQGVVPALARVAVQNPTVTSSAPDSSSLSPLYYSPSGRGRGGVHSVSVGCTRNARYTPLGECAVAALDACLAFNRAAQLRCLDLNSVLPNLPALLRCTKQSIHAPLRGAIYRALSYICTTPTILSLVVEEMPSIVATAVASVAAYSADAPQQWENAAAAAEWLCLVARLTARGKGTDSDAAGQVAYFSFAQSALPLRLLDVVATAPLNFATTALLTLCSVLSEREWEEMEAEGARGSDSISVLAPYGQRSLGNWTRLMQTATVANEKLTKLARLPVWASKGGDRSEQRGCQERSSPSNGVALTSSTTQDALTRALTARESITVQYAFTAAVLRCVVALFTRFPEHKTHLSHESVYRLASAALSVPCPARVLDMLSARFAVAVGPSPALTRAYDELVQWSCELAPVWLAVPTASTPGTPAAAAAAAAMDFPPMPAAVFESLARVMSDATLSQRTRCHVPLFISSILLPPLPTLPPPNPPAAADDKGDDRARTAGEKAAAAAAAAVQASPLHASLALLADRVFLASLSLKRLTCVSGMQCRLLSTFPLATEEAIRCGWFADRALDLDTLVKLLVRNGGAFNEHDKESYLVTLSLVSSVLANAACPELPRELRLTVCAALAEGVRFELTRMATLKALRAMSGSAEGRRCLLHDITTSGEPLARSCFGRVLAVTLRIPSVLGGSSGPRKSQQQLQSTKANRERLSGPVREALAEVTEELGLAILTRVCGARHEGGGGGNPFIAAFLKHRGADAVAKLIGASDAGRGRTGTQEGEASPISLSLLRLVAALSLDREMQVVLAQHSTLLTILVELAGTANTPGTLALLALRNVCFHPSLKAVLCQDMRVLLTLKAALMRLPTVEALALDPDLVFPRLDSGAAEASGGQHRSAAWRRQNAASSGAWSVLRRDITESNNTALTNWAVRATSSFYHDYIRSSSPSPKRDGSPSSSSPSARRAARAAAGAPPASPPPLPAVTRGGSRPECWTSGKPEGGPSAARSNGEHSSSPHELLRRQELAVSALWALMHDHQRGKVYVRRVLMQEPAVAVERLFPGFTPEAAEVGKDFPEGESVDGGAAVDSAGFGRAVWEEVEEDDGVGDVAGRDPRRYDFALVRRTQEFSPSFGPARSPLSAPPSSPSQPTGSDPVAVPPSTRLDRLEGGLRSIQLLGT